MSSSIPARLKDLYEAAREARSLAYCPYSGHKVGAAIRASDGKIYSGCNVENSSYGATICAERVAIQKAVSEGRTKVREVLVITDAVPPWPPCGMCRQVIGEFGRDAVIHSANLAGEIKTVPFDDLFPDAFTPGHLQKK